MSGAAGADEAGRGPLAGPVVAAAVILPDGFDLSGIDDSKKLTPERRLELATRIKDGAHWCVEVVDHLEVDSLNILWASMMGMSRALEKLPLSPSCVLIDGDKVPRGWENRATPVVQGDARYACIAAASILAKTERDRLMAELSLTYPHYGFEHNFGYPTPDHLEALRLHGPCPIHRRSFARIKEWEQPCLTFDE